MTGGLALTAMTAFAMLPNTPGRPARHNLGSLPGLRLSFRGGGSEAIASGSNYSVSVSATQTVVTHSEGFGDADHWFREEEFSVRFIGASSLAPLIADSGSDAVVFRDVYPRIAMRCEGSPEQIEYRFIAAPDADPYLIRVRIEGAGKIRIDSDGSVRASTPMGELRIYKPVTGNSHAGGESAVAGHFRLRSKGLVEFRAVPN